jgi:hypothetical protein
MDIFAASAGKRGVTINSLKSDNTRETTLFVKGNGSDPTFEISPLTGDGTFIVRETGRIGFGASITPDFRFELRFSEPTDYIESSTTAFTPLQPESPAISIQNYLINNSGASYFQLGARNSQDATGYAYIGAVSVNASYSPKFVFGMRTGITSYAETMRLRANNAFILTNGDGYTGNLAQIGYTSRVTNTIPTGVNGLNVLFPYNMDVNAGNLNGATFTAGSFYANPIFAGNNSIAAGGVMAGTVSINRLSWSAPNTSIIMEQAGTGIRAIAGHQVLQQCTAQANNTMSHGAGVFIQGVYNTAGTSNPLTFTNYYGLLMNDLNEWSGVNFTNRWGIYQAGALDKNFFNAQIFAPNVYANAITGTTRDLYIKSDGMIGYIASIRESKKNINKINDVDYLSLLNPVSFNYRKKDENNNFLEEIEDELEYGLIAAEVEQVNPEFCFYDILEDGTKILAGVNYKKLIIPILKKVQILESKLNKINN